MFSRNECGEPAAADHSVPTIYFPVRQHCGAETFSSLRTMWNYFGASTDIIAEHEVSYLSFSSGNGFSTVTFILSRMPRLLGKVPYESLNSVTVIPATKDKPQVCLTGQLVYKTVSTGINGSILLLIILLVMKWVNTSLINLLFTSNPWLQVFQLSWSRSPTLGTFSSYSHVHWKYTLGSCWYPKAVSRPCA